MPCIVAAPVLDVKLNTALTVQLLAGIVPLYVLPLSVPPQVLPAALAIVDPPDGVNVQE